MKNYLEYVLHFGGVRGKGLSSKTVSDYISVLRMLLRFIEKKYSYPCCTVNNIYLPKNQKPLRVFSREEMLMLTEYLKQSDERRDVGILLALFTGIRIGELCAIKEQNICLNTQTLSVRCTVQRIQRHNMPESKTCLLIDKPKSYCSVRDIPIPDFMVDILKPYMCCGDNYFLSGSTSKIIEPRNLQYHFKKLLENLNINNANFHACRHTFATLCVEQGFDIKSLSEILGHSTVNITLNKYVHPTMQMKRDNMEKLSELFKVN